VTSLLTYGRPVIVVLMLWSSSETELIFASAFFHRGTEINGADLFYIPELILSPNHKCQGIKQNLKH